MLGFDHDRKMEVLCACDERYLPHAATMLCSLLEHNRVPIIHVFHSTIPHGELSKLKSMVIRYGSELIFYEITSALQGLRVDEYASVAVYYRLLATRLLPRGLRKVLYLDCDTIVRRSLTELWNIDITGCALAAVADLCQEENGRALGLPIGARYFNSGVLLMNLQFWRQNSIPERVISFVRNNPQKMVHWDQDGLNATLYGQWLELPGVWNAQVNEWRALAVGTENDPAIVHFLTGDKPWQWSNAHPFKGEYREYRRRTPWWPYEQEGKPTFRQRAFGFLKRFAANSRDVSLRQWRRWVI